MKYLTGVLIVVAMLFCIPGPTSAEDEALADLQSGAVQLVEKCLPSVVVVDPRGGSGSIVDREGYVFTNYHVAGGLHVVEVTTYKREKLTAVVVGEDITIDFALLKIIDPPDDLTPMALADSDKVKPGDLCMSLGAPLALIEQEGLPQPIVDWDDPYSELIADRTCNLGVVNLVQNYQESLWTSSYYLSMGPGYGTHITYNFNIDAEINGGNSGGPSVNVYGEQIGINTFGAGTGNTQRESGNTCVPINHHRKAARDIMNYGRPRWAYLGVDILPRRFNNMGLTAAIETYVQASKPNSPFTSTELGPDEEGHTIRYVSPDSPAYEAGLRTGDVILSFNGMKYNDPLDICQTILMEHEVGDQIVLVIKRGERLFPKVEITLGPKYVINDNQITFSEGGGGGSSVDRFTRMTF